MYETAQVPLESVQVDAGEKLPTPLVAHVKVPVGEMPVTVAVQLEEELTVTGEGEQLTLAFMFAGVTCREKLPELSGLYKAPP